MNFEIHSNIEVAKEFWAKAVPLKHESIESAKVTILKGITPI